MVLRYNLWFNEFVFKKSVFLVKQKQKNLKNLTPIAYFGLVIMVCSKLKFSAVSLEIKTLKILLSAIVIK